ncbi:hypothetical protein, partial [Paraburkholderia hospita]|uniref:hypothetical protein n=1 Tax=Paraburkholderia hospita TaxID=169430 RepID=UPI001A9941ED
PNRPRHEGKSRMPAQSTSKPHHLRSKHRPPDASTKAKTPKQVPPSGEAVSWHPHIQPSSPTMQR